MNYDYLIVGAGLFGSVFAHLMKQQGKRCLVIDKRPHVGGNTYSPCIRGIHRHDYGAHIFHTSDPEVIDFVCQHAHFNRYTNSPVAIHRSKLFNLPFNMNTFHQMWGVKTPAEAQAMLEEQRREARAELQRLGLSQPQNLEQQALLLVGKDIYHTLIKGYTEKQWGCTANSLPPEIIRRLPVRFVFDNNYFNDSFQGIPEGGYNVLTDSLLDGIEVRLSEDFFDRREEWMKVAKKVVFSGPIDRFFDYCFGHLPYRSLRFEHLEVEESNFQGNAVVNYTEADVPYTRIIEHKHFESFGEDVYRLPHTLITKEYPAAWTPGAEPFYPINTPEANACHERYKQLAAQQDRVIFGGRLADYRYYDMAPTIRCALDAARKEAQ